jgi:uncharacterized protein with ParB-like and HNH nuclease domain
MLERLNNTQAVKFFVKNEEKINFGMEIQRGLVWKLEMKSDLIHTLITGYPLDPVTTVEKDGNIWNIADGKQRLTTIIDYVKGKYSLHAKTEDADGFDIAGLAFDDLPEEFKEVILDYPIRVDVFKKLNDEQIDKMFAKKNQGKQLSPVIHALAKFGSKMRVYLAKAANTEFFTTKANYSLVDINGKEVHWAVLQIMALLNEEDISFSNKDVKNFGMKLKDNIPENLDKRLYEIINYLDEAFKNDNGEVNKNDDTEFKCIPQLKKIHIPMIFQTANEYMDRIEPNKFGTIILEFINEQKIIRKQHRDNPTIPLSKYIEACDDSTNTKDNVNIRIEEMCAYMDEKISRFEADEEESKPDLKLVEREDEREIA